MHPVPLVATTRGFPDTGCPVENIHYGSVAVVDVSGRLLFSSGDPDFMTFTRPALKPFQATPFVLDDGPARLKLTRDELAMHRRLLGAELRDAAGAPGPPVRAPRARRQ
jgi:hypothetical protein